MPERDQGNRPLITLPEAAAYLHLPIDAVRALVGSSYLVPAKEGPEGPLIPLVDLKAFLARNADNGSGNLITIEPDAADPQALLDALDGRSEEMAKRAFDIFATVFPEAQTWPMNDQARFIEQAKGRFEAILAVTGQGHEVDEALVDDLQEVGAAAAWDGSPLPQLLVILRISRDLVVQTAVELAEERGRHWGLALSLLLTRILPAMDRLTDALAQGYWSAILTRQAEAKDRYEHVVENSSDGVYEVDLDGRILYANHSLALILGRRIEDLAGASLYEVLAPTDPDDSLEKLTTEGPEGVQRVELTVARPDGVRRVLDIRTTSRRREDMLVGFQGMVADVTAAKDLETDKNEFLALVTNDLRTPLTMILGLGSTLETHSEELPGERIRRMGSSIRGQAERIARLADDLADMSRLDTRAMLLSPRIVDLTPVIEAARATAGEHGDDVVVDVPEGITVISDPRRLEQVLANLVENAGQHGAPPVTIELVGSADGLLELAVTDVGPGVPPQLVPTLFSRVRTLSRPNRDRSRGTGLGLALVRGLMEAMGGRVWYEGGKPRGASFHLTVPVPRRRAED